ncbi:HdeD family acid-resistance protein [Vagococcus fluvialis]|uniref:HdeD family acid-resistance protein n=1 Tax=Vagococcus fluvialis TaxID=2738 RepID=UPI003D1108CB
MSENIKTEESKSTDWLRLIVGILLVVAALFSFNNPNFNVLNVVIFYSIVMIASGIQLIATGVQEKKNTIVLIILGVLNVILGILIVLNLWYSLLITPYFFGIWVIIQSIAGLFTLGSIRKESKGAFWFSLILSILGIVLGISLLNHPLISYLTVAYLFGLGLMCLGIKNIIDSFN